MQNVYDAQYERSGAGVVTLVTKSGTNAFHGEVYDYMRNSALDANSWSNGHYGAAKGLFHRNQFGGNFGGPVVRNRLFFFAAYEGLRQPETDSTLATVPTAAMRREIFLNCPIPFTTHFRHHDSSGGYLTRDPFPGNLIPSTLWDPVGQKIVALYPQPNVPGAGLSNNYFAQGPGSTKNDKFDWRLDWNRKRQQ